ncbi:MAG: hypothetical protein M1821_005321 [Bathelium mastoideum]|nr:MAG: hypothetical protein M1821_005321 [Bathelium mastoideum]KAI9688131.1 MAG: hypothetical protein M1822_001637 [Bathelium mastoideum]
MAISSSLPYVEPNIVTVLVLSSFLLLSNVLNSLLDKLIYCGLVGQVLLGVAWGTPGGNWISGAAENTIVQLGYLGLILLVYEGGLTTSFATMKANFLLSVCVALTGIGLPIALSFVLTVLAGASPLQAFAAGAALCSTSLGTTLTILNTSELSHTRLGVVLVSAAMIDDVVGLVMVQVVSNLASNSIAAATIVRPIMVSLAFAVCIPVACWLSIKPATKALNQMREAKPDGRINKILLRAETAFTIHTALLIVLVTAASYAGTSNLFAAYLAGAMVSWWDSEVPHIESPVSLKTKMSESCGPGIAAAAIEAPSVSNEMTTLATTSRHPAIPGQRQSSVAKSARMGTSGTAIYERYYKQTVRRVLKPFFFTSIGFSIPISKMFSGTVVWKGMIYTVLMVLGKLMCGIWLVRIPTTQLALPKILLALRPPFRHLRRRTSATKHGQQNKQAAAFSGERNSEIKSAKQQKQKVRCHHMADRTPRSDEHKCMQNSPETRSSEKPISLYPCAILGFAMVARGEIGFLISALAQSNGIFGNASSLSSTDSESEMFLVVTWAIVLCTLIGPLCVGTLVRRVKKLEGGSASQGNRKVEGRRDVLGVWAVQ